MKKQLRPKIRTDGRMAEKLIDYDEVGNIKKASEDEITTSYNMKNGVYQSDPYNFVISKNTQGLLVQYSYSSKNLLESVKTPDGKEVKYTRNALNEIADIDGWIKNCDYYSDKLIKNYETVSGIEVNRKYDTERNLTNLSYTQNSVILENYDYAYDNNFNLIRKNKNTYTYDSLNRLSTAFECDGKYEKPSDENEIKLYETIKDVAANKDGEVLLTGQEEVIFDAGAKSIIADFGTEQLISKIKISPNYKVTRVYADDVSLYIRSEDGDWRPITNCGKKKNERDGSITIILNKHEMGRYVKVHNLYDERTYDNEIDASFSTFKNKAESIIQITTVGSVLDESYDYDNISNRTEYVLNHKRYKLEYYKNTAGGNSSLVKNDGTYEYKYDKNGNRIAKVGNGEVWKYTWDLRNRLIKVEMETNGNKLVEVSYKYDHENNKLTRECDGNVTYYMYDFEGKLLYEKNDGYCRNYVYMGTRLVGFTESENKYYVITDETGSVRKIYEGDSEVWCGTYSPFGKLMSYEGELEISALFAGKEIDPETGLTYHWYRWRNEDGNAFISEDPLRDGYNWYGYANANPLKYADSNGLESYVCRDGTFCSEGDLSNASYRADCYFYNGYNSGTIASMSGPAYSLYNNGGQATLSLAGTRADPGRNKSSPSAAEEIKNCGNIDVENVTRGKIADTVVLLENKDEVNERISKLLIEVNSKEKEHEESNKSFDSKMRILNNGDFFVYAVPTFEGQRAEGPVFPIGINGDFQYLSQKKEIIGKVLPNIQNYLELVGDATSYASLGFNVVSIGCTYAGAFPAAGTFSSAAAVMDSVAFFAYLSAGCSKKAGFAFVSIGVDIVPFLAPNLKPAYNPIAKRFINDSTKRFIPTNVGLAKCYLFPAVGLGLSVSSNFDEGD